MHARTVQEDRARYQRGCTQSCPFTEGHARVRAIEQCTQKSRDAFCTPEGPTRLRAYAPTRSHRRTRRVPPRRYRAEPQDDGAASTRPANRWSVCVDCVRGLAGRFWCSPIRRLRQTKNRPKSPPTSKANYGEAFFDSIDPHETLGAERCVVSGSASASRQSGLDVVVFGPTERPMRRREFSMLFGGAAVYWPFAARAQQPEQMRRIGVLMNRAAGDPEGRARVAAFRHGLEQLGWTDGRNVRIDIRWGEDDADRERRYAAELVGLEPDVMLAAGTLGVTALRHVTSTLPIVFVGVGDPVGAGVVESLARA